MKLVHTFYNINDNKAHEFINHICFILSCLCAKKLGYNIDILKIIEFKDAFDCKEFETTQKRIIKPNK